MLGICFSLDFQRYLSFPINRSSLIGKVSNGEP